jgi:uncharacterized damage-inducible protein DinB
MVAKEILASFLEYNYSANESTLLQLEQLSHEQLYARIKISHGCAFDLIRHMLDTEWSWRMFTQGNPGGKYLWEVEDIPNLPAIQRFWSSELEQVLGYLRSLEEEDLNKEIDYGSAQGGTPHYCKVWQILLHIVNHSTHHRSELNSYLDICGHPINEQELDYISFVEQS